jgi:hypothetical protein
VQQCPAEAMEKEKEEEEEACVHFNEGRPFN